MPQRYSQIRVILVNKANIINLLMIIMMMLAIAVAMITLVIVMTMKVSITEYLLPYSGLVLNMLYVLLHQVFLTTLIRYFYHTCFIGGETSVK